MDTPLILAPAASAPASALQDLPPVATPLMEAELAAPVRIAPRKVAPFAPAPIRPEKVPLGILALTVVTAVLLVLGAGSVDPEGARIMDFAAAQPQP